MAEGVAPQALSEPVGGNVLVSGIRGLVSGLMAAIGLGPNALTAPVAPAESPALWAMLAWARRQFGQSGASPTAAATGQTLDVGLQALALAAPNNPPVASQPPTVGSPDPVTGVASGALNVTDPDGNTLSYSVTGAPTKGTVTVDAVGTYTYTPSQAARLAAHDTPGADTDGFKVTATDGQASVEVTVSNVQVSPAELAVGSTTVPTGAGSGPAGVVVNGNRAYVANSGTNTVAVIDTAANTVLTTVPVVKDPTALAISADGSRLYVASYSYLSVIDTATNTVITKRYVGHGQGNALIMSPDGSKLYESNNGRQITVIDTATTKVSKRIRVGANPSGISFGADGTRVYVANNRSNTVSVINTATNRVVATVRVGNVKPYATAASPDGAKVYVANQNGTLTAIDTATNTVVSSPITLGATPSAIAVSPDASLAYITNTNDTVTVVDTKTNTIIRTLTIDTAPETGNHGLTLSANGMTVYITDAADNTLRQVTLGSTNHPPTVTVTNVSGPTADGTTTFTTNVTDPDAGDTVHLTFTTDHNGNVTQVNSTTFKYTPDAAYAHSLSDQNNYNGPGSDVIHVTATDTYGGATDTESFTVTVNPADQNPVLTVPNDPSDFATSPDGSVTFTVGATDPDGDHVTVTVIASHGTITDLGNGMYKYVPNADYAHSLSADTYTGPLSDYAYVTALDGHYGGIAQYVNVPVTPVNHDPQAGTATVADPTGASGLVTGSLGVIDTDAGDQQQLSYTVTDGPSHGTVEIAADGAYTYRPDGDRRLSDYISGDTTTDSFTVTVSDHHGGQTTVTVNNIQVEPAPAAVIDSATVAGNPYNAPVLGPDGRYYVATANYSNGSRTSIVVIDPADPTHPTVLPGGYGYPSGSPTFGADGTIYQTVSGSGTHVLAIRPNDPTHPVDIAAGPGSPYGPLKVGPDGTMYQASSANGSTAYVTVIDPDDLTHPVTVPIPSTEYPSYEGPKLSFAPNGKAYFVTSNSTSALLTVIDPNDPADATTINLPGYYANAPTFGPDGTAVVTVQTQTCDNNGCRISAAMTFVDRNDPTKFSTVDLGAFGYSPTFGPDGTAYLTHNLAYAGGCQGSTCPDDYAMEVIDPDDVEHPVTVDLPGNQSISTAFASDGTRYETRYTYTCTGGSCTQTGYTMTVVDPDDATNYAVFNLASSPRGNVVVAPGGTAYQTLNTTYTISGSTTTYNTQILVFSPTDPYHPATLNIPNSASSSVVLAGGRAYQPAGNRIYLINPADPTNPTIINLPGQSYLNPVVGSDGTLYQASSAVSSGPTYTTNITAITPNDPTNPIIVNLGTGQPTAQLIIGADGKLYQETVTGTSGLGWNGLTTHLVVLDPSDPTHPTNITAGAGYPSTLVFGPNGTLYQPSYTYTSSGGTTVYTSHLAVINPDDPTHPTIVDAPGSTNYLTFGSDGTGYLTTAGSGTTYVTVIDPDDPSHFSTATAGAGNAYGGVTFGPDGTAYQTSYDPSSIVGGSITASKVTVINKGDPASSVTFNLSGYPTLTFGPDGTAYHTSVTSAGNGQDLTYSEAVTAIDPSDPSHPTTVTITYDDQFYYQYRQYKDPVFGPDGTRYEVSRAATCADSGSCDYQYAVTVFDPDDPDNWTTIRLLYGSSNDVVVDADGVGYLTLGAVDDPDLGVVTPVLVFRPDDPYHPTTVEMQGYAEGNVVSAANGAVFQVTGDDGSTRISVIDVVPNGTDSSV